MTSVAVSHTSTRSKSTKHDRTRSEQRPRTPDGIEKLAVKTAALHLEPATKTGLPRPDFPAETLPVMLGDRTRRSRCSPEFLLEMSARDPSDFFKQHGKKLKIITGPEAVTFYKKFLGWRNVVEILAEMEGVAEGLDRPCVVFAVAVEDAGRQSIDYYATWPRTEGARNAAEAKQLKYFHSQFRKTARALDSEFRRANFHGVAETIIVEPEKKADELQEPSIVQEPMTAKAHPPSIAPPLPEMKVDMKSSTPASATDSVMSLPYLNFIRNVPNGHRIPLRVTNPDDRLSTISPSPITSPATPTKASHPPTSAFTNQNKPNYFPTPTPFSTPSPAEKLLMPEGITRSNSSTWSSRSKDSTRSSVASTVSKGSHRKKPKVKEIPEFLMVLLDGRIEKEARTWHGLERQNSRSTPRTTSRVSLWDGPLAREVGGRPFAYRTRSDGEESSEEEEDLDNSPVIPPPPHFLVIERSRSEPRYLPPVMPPAVQGYRMPVSLGGSIGSFTNLAHGPSPLPPPAPVSYPPSPYAPVTYASPYRPPAVPPMRPLSESAYPPQFQQ
ncbi:hypothetical protein E4T56_gene169 [Termitomyces sp. T112]|nr:hypothetical protein E4T56_gene169 [Termitomyces sp. T112]KAH0591223.1 hypothetical protein H2248_001316 [Termitomyces sp. 'cryptogamus']